MTIGGPEHAGQTLLSVLWALSGRRRARSSAWSRTTATTRLVGLGAARASRRRRCSSTTCPSSTASRGSRASSASACCCCSARSPGSACARDPYPEPGDAAGTPPSHLGRRGAARGRDARDPLRVHGRAARPAHPGRAAGGLPAANHIGKAVSIFGSARTPPEHPRYEAGPPARPPPGRAGLRDHHRRRPRDHGGRQPRARRTSARRASASGSSSRTSSRSTSTATSASTSTTSSRGR